mmetsp:Transcript_26344/g.63498  ORF Transcript_26344/g.63498 Transcript_26344/m.63498 type:complete len:278 (+) Transcript_26344:183-1016(+)
MSLADCIRREKGTKDPSEVEALCLDQAKCTEGLGALEPFAQLGSLSIQDAGISSLETLPALEYLTELKMSDNKIKGGLEHLLRCPNLERLYLAGNQIATLDALEKLSGLSKLELLDLEGNPVTKEPSYSTKVFDMFNNLIALDNKNRQGEEIEEDDDDDEDDEDEDDDEGDDDDEEDRPKKKAAYADDEDDEDGEEDGGDDDDDDDDDEDDDGPQEGFTEYTEYGNILGGDAPAYEEEEDDEEFQPTGDDPEDFDIPEDEEEVSESVLGKHGREGST